MEYNSLVRGEVEWGGRGLGFFLSNFKVVFLLLLALLFVCILFDCFGFCFCYGLYVPEDGCVFLQ